MMAKARLVIGGTIIWQETLADGQSYDMTGRVLRVGKRGHSVTLEILAVSAGSAAAGLVGKAITRKPHQLFAPAQKPAAAIAPEIKKPMRGHAAAHFLKAATRPITSPLPPKPQPVKGKANEGFKRA